MLQVERNVDLKSYTTLGVGGKAKYLIKIKSLVEAVQAYEYVSNQSLPWIMIGQGSNLLVSDAGFEGVVLVNQIISVPGGKFKAVVIGAGLELNYFVDSANRNGAAGFECLAGIPGTIGGAVYGNAGAYGQTISDKLIAVNTLTGRLTKAQCEFGYRDSVFKHKKLVILSIEFDDYGEAAWYPERAIPLVAKSKEIRELRLKKYPAGLKCPGSFFKNILVSRLRRNQLAKISPEKIVHGKVPAGYLLEKVGACGMRLGGAKVADYHGNLIVNEGGASFTDIWELAMLLRERVYDRFGLELEPEVQTLM